MSTLSRIAHWYFTKNALPLWAVLFLDCVIVMVSMLFIFTLNNGLIYTASNIGAVTGILAIYLCCYIVAFRLMRTYAGIIRFSSFVDLQRVAGALALGMLLALALRYFADLNTRIFPVRARDLLEATLMAVALMWGYRVVVKYVYDNFFKSRHAERVFIYGIKHGGVALAKSIRNQESSSYQLCGFVADPGECSPSMSVMGQRVYPADETLLDHMREQHIKTLLVSPLRTGAISNNKVLREQLVDAGVRIFVFPAAQVWDGKSDISALTMHEIEIEDLLPRPEIEINLEAIGRHLKGKRILVTGAAGSIGSEIARQVAVFGPEQLVLLDQAETPLHDVRLEMRRLHPDIPAATIVADIAHAERMEQIFDQYRPQIIYHAAAYKHVPMMEDFPCEAIQNNIIGTRIVADLAVKHAAEKFVMVSTDKAVNPTNVMGCSKRICEIYIQALDNAIKTGQVEGETRFITTRFGNVLGSNGSVIPLFREQIRTGGPVTITHPEIVRYFMLIPEACKLVLEAGVMGQGGEIFVFDMGEPVKIIDLARRMIQLSGKHVDIVCTGLRAGEKLYEEVLSDHENTLPSFHPKIRIAKARIYDYNTIKREIDNLDSVCVDEPDDMNLVAHMKRIVPEYRSEHSKYSALDATPPPSS